MKDKKDKYNQLFSAKDFRHFESLGLDWCKLEEQLKMHRRGRFFLKLKKPCSVGDGIFELSAGERRKWIAYYEKESTKYNLMKFVPASGAASRMFAEWHTAAEKGSFGRAVRDKIFFDNLKKFPFWGLIVEDERGRGFLKDKDLSGLLNFILSATGLNFGNLPKALIHFHLYQSGEMRNPLQEHVCEAAHYVRGKNNTCHIHFTFSPGFGRKAGAFLRKVLPHYEKAYHIKYAITFSAQEFSTNTIAVDSNNVPLRDDRGRIIFRPGGHGTLLENLNRLDADFIFIRNIDNVAPETYWNKIVSHKKMLGGLAIKIQEEIFSAIRRLKSLRISDSAIRDIISFCSRDLNIDFPANMIRWPRRDKITFLISSLNRPLRVCAMVRNVKEPGGGPFWVEEDDGTMTLQIVESVHVDHSMKDQSAIWAESKYFNPVDMVCGIKDYRGRKFDLSRFVNKRSYLITTKSEKGREIKALETPGLWNGSMAYWNTIFVKLPLVVFNPVKTAEDLLRPEHVMSRKTRLSKN